MKNKNYFLIIASILNFGTFLLHLIGGQIDLIKPLLESNVSDQVQAELIGVWHMVSIVLLCTSVALYLKGVKKDTGLFSEVNIRWIGYLYLLFGLPFMMVSLWTGRLAPQWILLMPIGILALLGTPEKPYAPSSE